MGTETVRLENTTVKAYVLNYEGETVTVPRREEDMVVDSATGLSKKRTINGSVDVDGEWLTRLRAAKGKKKKGVDAKGEPVWVDSDAPLFPSVEALFEEGSLVVKAPKRQAAPTPAK